MRQKPSTMRAGGAGQQQRHYYRLPAESKAGKLLSQFWHACQKCEQAADEYCHKIGAKTFYSDPAYFAGGVSCLGFGEGVKPDPAEWRSIGVIEGEEYFVPACEVKQDLVEVPHREYQMRDTWDTMYLRSQIREQTVRTEDGATRKALMIPRLTFMPTEANQPATDKNGRKPAVSRRFRRACLAEQKRRKLPVMSVQQIYRILEALIPEGRLADVTPTFFLRSTTYYIGCPYPCRQKGMEEITMQQYNLNLGLLRSELRNRGN